jgi:protein SCO1
MVGIQSTSQSVAGLQQAPVSMQPQFHTLHPMRPRARIVLLAAVTTLVLALALVMIFAGSPNRRSPTQSIASDIPSASGFDGAALPPGIPAHDFTLTSLATPTGQTAGGPVSLTSFRGQVVVLAFLYSTCGPTCIVIAQQIRGALNELAHPASVIIVSADPAADTPTRARAFLAQVSLAGRAYYLTGPPSQLHTIWRAYRATPASAGRVAFDSAATVLLIDPAGLERVEFGVEQLTPESLTHDIGKLDGDPTHP